MMTYYRALQRMTINKIKGQIGGSHLEPGTTVIVLDRLLVDFGHTKAVNIFVLAENGAMGYCYYDSEHWEQL